MYVYMHIYVFYFPDNLLSGSIENRKRDTISLTGSCSLIGFEKIKR